MSDKDNYFHISVVLRIQRWSWYLLVLLFGVSTVLYALRIDIASTLCFVSVVLMLVIALVVALVISEQFRRAKLYRFGLLGYVMILISLCTLLLKWYL